MPLASQRLSTLLPGGFRFFHHPLPADPSASLAACFPILLGGLRVYHVPCKYLSGLGSASPPGVHHLRSVNLEHRYLTPCLLAQACDPFGAFSTFGLFVITMFISGSYLLAIPLNASPRPPWCWQSQWFLAIPIAIPEEMRDTLSRRLRTLSAPKRMVFLIAHAPVAYRWQNTGFHPASSFSAKTCSRNSYLHDFVSHPKINKKPPTHPIT